MMTEQLALVKGVTVGLWEGSPSLWFSTSLSENDWALQVFREEDMLYVISEAGLRNIKDLEGRVCWVEVLDDQIIFRRFFK